MEYDGNRTPNSHTVEYKSSNVSSVNYVKVGQDLKLTFHFNNDLPEGYYSYDFDLCKSTTTSMEMFLYGEAGGSGFDCKTLHRFWASNQDSGQTYRIGSDSGQGKRFLKLTGKQTQIHGNLELKSNVIYNHGMPFTVNLDGDRGESYTFLKQKLTLNTTGANGNKLVGSSLTFVFEPYNNTATTYGQDCEFKLFRLS